MPASWSSDDGSTPECSPRSRLREGNACASDISAGASDGALTLRASSDRALSRLRASDERGGGSSESGGSAAASPARPAGVGGAGMIKNLSQTLSQAILDSSEEDSDTDADSEDTSPRKKRAGGGKGRGAGASSRRPRGMRVRRVRRVRPLS